MKRGEEERKGERERERESACVIEGSSCMGISQVYGFPGEKEREGEKKKKKKRRRRSSLLNRSFVARG